MSQRESGYERRERDLYETPEWVTKAVLPHIAERVRYVWEPACGNGKMAFAFDGRFIVVATDINPGVAVTNLFTPQRDEEALGLQESDVFERDFLATSASWLGRRFGQCQAIITNPPYDLATEFCEHAQRLMEPVGGVVAMLLRTDFDHAKSRTHLFRDCPAFAKKLVLMKRIAWFVEADGKPKASPSFNHAWYIWDWTNDGPPRITYGP